MIDLDLISQEIAAATHEPFAVKNNKNIGGGCINQAFEIIGENSSYFVKCNRSGLLSMFEAEYYGLREMAATGTIKVPEPVVFGVAGDQSYLVMEMLQLGGAKQNSLRLMGVQLAAMHRQHQAYFGWNMENTIGSTRQVNIRSDDWVEFFAEHRLHFQLQLAANNGFRGRLQQNGARLCADLKGFFEDYSVKPVLLHGDLWSGNAASDQSGNPVIFDPACYYGDHEADLAMTELFGGFGSDFYAAYREHKSIDPGYAVRKHLYNLYHILNHLNLFGGGYLGQAENLMDRLLAEL